MRLATKNTTKIAGYYKIDKIQNFPKKAKIAYILDNRTPDFEYIKLSLETPSFWLSTNKKKKVDDKSAWKMIFNLDS